MRVKGITFLRRSDGQEVVVQAVGSPLDPLTIKAGTGVNSVRIVFTQPFAQDAHLPTTAGKQDPDYQSHNVLVLVPQPKQGQLPYLPGALAIEAADTVRFDVFPVVGTVAANLPWPPNAYRLFLRASDDTVNKRVGVADKASDLALDGEPAVPGASTGNAISGDGVAGGDFNFPFTVA